MDKEPPYKLLVTEQQLSQGYFVTAGLVWVISRQYAFEVIEDHGDGTITVVNPVWREWKHRKEVGGK